MASVGFTSRRESGGLLPRRVSRHPRPWLLSTPLCAPRQARLGLPCCGAPSTARGSADYETRAALVKRESTRYPAPHASRVPHPRSPARASVRRPRSGVCVGLRSIRRARAVRVWPAAYWLVSGLVTLGVTAGPRVDSPADGDRAAARAPVLGRAVGLGWGALDDLPMADPASDIEKAGLLHAAAALAVGMPRLGALRRRVERRGAAGCPGASSPRGPPRVLDARSDSRPTAPSRLSARSIRGRGPPARAKLEPRAAPCCPSNRSPTQEERS